MDNEKKIIDVEAKDVTDVKKQKHRKRKKPIRKTLPLKYRTLFIAYDKASFIQLHKIDILGFSVPVIFIFLGPLGWYMGTMYCIIRGLEYVQDVQT